MKAARRNRRAFWDSLILHVAFLSGCLSPQQSPPMVWEHDHEAAIARAKALGQPVLISFSAPWCGACEKLRQEVWPDAGVQQAAARFVAVYVDASLSDGPAAQAFKAYAVESLPTVVFIDSAGTVLHKPRLNTYVSAKAMKTLLRSIP